MYIYTYIYVDALAKEDKTNTENTEFIFMIIEVKCIKKV